MQIDVRNLPSTVFFTLGADRGYFPVLATVTGEDVLIVWRAGAGHMGITGRLEAVRSDHGEHWSEPVVIADSDWDDRNPAVGVTAGGVIVVAYHANGCYRGEKQYDPALGRLCSRLSRSHDGGRTWEKPYPLSLEAFEGFSPYGQMLTMPDGGLLMPIYGAAKWREDPNAAASSFLLRSDDEGLTWALHSHVGEGINESAFLALPEGGILGVARSAGQTAHLVSTRAEGGLSWTPPASLTQAHEHPACLTALSTGAVLLCYGYREKPFGARGLVSPDAGRSWLRDRQIIFSDSADNWDCGYPSTVRLTDGRLVTAHYSTAGKPDGWSCRGAHCHVLAYREDELLRALA